MITVRFLSSHNTPPPKLRKAVVVEESRQKSNRYKGGTDVRKIRETGKASLGGGRKSQDASGVFYHLTQDEYDQMLADPACDTDAFEADVMEILEKKRIEPDLAYKIREDSIRAAELGHWIDM